MKDKKFNWWRFHSHTHKTITFVVTQDCQLACRYCYLVGKNVNGKMSFDVARAAVDYILDNPEFFNEKSVIFDFIGGEPFLEIELIDRICDYIKVQLYVRNHHWFSNYIFGVSTNGLNYHSAKVQNFIRKNKQHLQIGITIDGTREKHDLNRIYKESGAGSYDNVVRNIPLWLSQFPQIGTKVTISSEDLPYVCESVMHLAKLGINTVSMNCVFEDVWKDGDDMLLESQLMELADRIIEAGLYKTFTCSMFDRNIGTQNIDDKNWCGSGKMTAIDHNGNFYPCNRFLGFSLRNRSPRILGNINDGIDPNRIRPFVLLDRSTQSPEKCKFCEISKGCAWCQGENYDAADSDTIYQRSTAICKMHHARVKANNYYWNKIDMVENRTQNNELS